MPIGKCSIEIDKFNTKMFPRNYGEVICFVSKSWLNCSSAHSSQVPRRFFLFGRELGGRHEEEQKGTRRIVGQSRSYLVSRLVPVPRTQRKNGGTGKRKETTGDLAKMIRFA